MTIKRVDDLCVSVCVFRFVWAEKGGGVIVCVWRCKYWTESYIWGVASYILEFMLKQINEHLISSRDR